MTPHRVLVTGASGFAGSHLARRLVGLGCDVHVLGRPTSDLARLDDIRDVVGLHLADLRDPDSVAVAVRAVRPDHVFHLAAATMHAGHSPGPDEQVMTNIRGTVALLNACQDAGVDAFVNVGDAFEYGPADGPIAETAHCRPTSLDGITKLAATLYGRSLARSADMSVVTVRPFSIVGSADDPRRLVPRLVDAARTGAPVTLSDRRIVRDIVWVDDMIGLCLLAAERSAELRGEILNCGSGSATTLGELVATIEATTGTVFPAEWGAFPVATHDFHHPVADTVATRALGWRATTPLASMIERLWRADVPGQPSSGASGRSR